MSKINGGHLVAKHLKEVEQLASWTIAAFGQVDVLHNNAGVGYGGPLELFPLEDWERIVGINLWSAVFGIEFFLPHMIERRSGHIVSTSSAAGFSGLPALPEAWALWALRRASETAHDALLRLGVKLAW